MRYAQRGGYTPAEQQRRERLRLEAAGRFARGDTIGEIARDLRVTEGSVRRWQRAWRDGGAEALRSRGPVSREKLSPQQWARLELELRKGPLAHGFAADQRWTLGRIKTQVTMAHASRRPARRTAADIIQAPPGQGEPSCPQRIRRRSRRCMPAAETGDRGRPKGSMKSAHGPVAAGTVPSRSLML